MRVLFAITLAVPAVLGAQGKAAAPKATPTIIAGGSSTARTTTPAPAATPATAAAAPAAAAKPGAAPAAATPAPATVAAKPGAAAPATPAKGAAPAATPAKGAAVAAGAAAVAGAAAATAAKPGAAPAAPAKDAAAPAVAAGAAPATAPANAQSATGASITIDRELYNYERGGRRDPFSSLLQSEDLKPAVADLRLIGVVLDPRGRNSIAVMRDQSTKELYRVRPGQSIGRLRVTQISQRSVTFLIEEFGVTRQETLSLKDANTARNP